MNNDFVIEDGVLKEYEGNDRIVVIPDGVRRISFNFKYVKNVKSVIIPSTVKNIGGFAFVGCKNIKRIIMHAGVKIIDDYAFDGCESLESIIIPDSVVRIGEFAFRNCKKLRSIIIPGSVICIDNGAFYGCTSLDNVVISKKFMRDIYGYFDYRNIDSINFTYNVEEEKETWVKVRKRNINDDKR